MAISQLQFKSQDQDSELQFMCIFQMYLNTTMQMLWRLLKRSIVLKSFRSQKKMDFMKQEMSNDQVSQQLNKYRECMMLLLSSFKWKINSQKQKSSKQKVKSKNMKKSLKKNMQNLRVLIMLKNQKHISQLKFTQFKKLKKKSMNQIHLQINILIKKKSSMSQFTILIKSQQESIIKKNIKQSILQSIKLNTMLSIKQSIILSIRQNIIQSIILIKKLKYIINILSVSLLIVNIIWLNHQMLHQK